MSVPPQYLTCRADTLYARGQSEPRTFYKNYCSPVARSTIHNGPPHVAVYLILTSIQTFQVRCLARALSTMVLVPYELREGGSFVEVRALWIKAICWLGLFDTHRRDNRR